jgi:hypothetical protein
VRISHSEDDMRPAAMEPAFCALLRHRFKLW